jgi:hypothetical protein
MPDGCQFYIYTQETKGELNLIGDCLSGAFFFVRCCYRITRGTRRGFPLCIITGETTGGGARTPPGNTSHKKQNKIKEKNCCRDFRH